MKKDKKKPHGHTYRANNSVNDKNYVGQTVDSRWPEGKNPLIDLFSCSLHGILL